MSFIRFLFWLILIVAIGLLPFEAAAQKHRGDAVFLKNGSVVYGRIIQHDSLTGLRIENECGNWLYGFHEIDSIGSHFTSRHFMPRNSGYFNISSLGLLFTDQDAPAPSITMIHGYKFGTAFSVGIGTGYEHFDWGVLPLFADARYFFQSDGFSPFLFGQAGYAITLYRDAEYHWGGTTERGFGGPMLGAGAGVRAGISRNTAFIFSVSYRFQRLFTETTNPWEAGTNRKTITHYNRIALTVGFLFE